MKDKYPVTIISVSTVQATKAPTPETSAVSLPPSY